MTTPTKKLSRAARKEAKERKRLHDARLRQARAADPAARIKVVSDEQIADLERRAGIASGVRKMRLELELSRQQARRATRMRLERTSGEVTDRPVLRADGRGFIGRGGGRMATLMPPVEYRATTDQVAGLYPWIVGASAPILGGPVGEHLSTGAPVCFDPISAWRAKAITAPSVFIAGLNGFGKSTLLRKIALADIAAGRTVFWPGDVKPDGRVLTEKVGGQVLEVGYGVGTINPLDPGPIGAAVEKLTDPLVRRSTEFALWQRQLNLVAALMEIVRRAPLRDFEETLLATAIRLLYASRRHGGQGFDRHHPATLSDLLTLLDNGHPELLADAVTQKQEEYGEQIKPLLRTLRALVKGRFGEVFNGRDTVRLDTSAPSICLDMSSVPPGDELMRAAVLLAGWNEAFATIEAAHVLADAGLGPNRAFHVVMDEMWQVLQCGPALVRRIDAAQRLQRSLGCAVTAVSHSLHEFEAAGALGFIERSRARIIGPVPRAEVQRLAAVITFSEKEKEMLTSWSDTADLTTVIDQRRARGRRGRAPLAAGTGHFLLKLGEGGRPGIPFRVVVSDAERRAGIHDTDARLRAAERDRERVEVPA